MVWSEGALVALKFWFAVWSHSFFGCTTVWSEGFGSHDCLLRGQNLGDGMIRMVYGRAPKPWECAEYAKIPQELSWMRWNAMKCVEIRWLFNFLSGIILIRWNALKLCKKCIQNSVYFLNNFSRFQRFLALVPLSWFHLNY